LYCTPSIVQVIIPRKIKWAGHAARMGDRRGVYSVLGNLRKRDHLRDPSIGGRIILRWIFRK
jgi:hypothetical protein